jgi:hypothetical protein
VRVRDDRDSDGRSVRHDPNLSGAGTPSAGPAAT